MNKEDWDDMRIVLAVARAGSFAQAARLLHVNESTVVRKVGCAEQRLRARLFDRKHGRVTPTEAGHALVQRAERIESVVQDATDCIRDADSRIAGTVRLTSVPLMVNRVLIPLLPDLVRRHPHLEVDLVADARVLSLARRETDIALRLARPMDGVRAVTRKVGELHYAVYSLRGADARSLPWLTYGTGMDMLPQVEWTQRLMQEGSPRSVVRVNDGEGLLAGALAGLGRALLPTVVGDRIDGLVRTDVDRPPLVRELWLVVHSDLRRLDRVRVVMDWVVQVCADITPEGAQVQERSLSQMCG
ncbi:LysR family transcriptional regulator [Paracidovorax anthurii]|uniref:LysR family transcriptional regulator n=2 Tax=Paracidovorax anthurii TaxID=78229 RepID=A0A328Z895_9BURK|nr:LysR family transcriptional regulator [Paracidovorax anthurii]